ncbi:hypothetical protein M409DRAFT_55725 [Zasmidium cellare ATCC 36951]|uniref:AA1-like domain-containing protein n=1 Tax=Zasmidium cellare ATCC 36951 TaxID=1080233 RepID=A0A6A6CDX9_ZASCE|nr:uncharacterized protein M409DRAFT_55725 [Zasmidium cellare ATCC 36951]KAF2165305.1 hypothetical protein M409DRAFT_55725 [Zasmidium cellare ATCC 36951]
MHHHLITTLTLLTLSHTALTLKLPARQTPNLWHISDSYIGCDPTVGCSYQFHVLGDDTGQLPYFEADCIQNVPIGDTALQQCNLVGAGSQFGLSVDGVYASGEFYPGNQVGSRVVVQLEFSDARRGTREFWQASQDGTYQTFSRDLGDYDVIPLQAAAVA